MLASTIGYVRITEFSAVSRSIHKAVEDLKAQGATRMVFDSAQTTAAVWLMK
jgi:C-terminal processing protease CtpA/Prc